MLDSVAETFRKNPKFETEEVITQLGIGEALVSVMDTDGTPTIVDRVFIKPPVSRLGAITPDERGRCMSASTLQSKYIKTIDRESAYEKLAARAAQIEQEQVNQDDIQEERRAPARRTDSIVESVIKSTMRAAGTQFGRQLIRGVLGGLFGKRR